MSTVQMCRNLCMAPLLLLFLTVRCTRPVMIKYSHHVMFEGDKCVKEGANVLVLNNKYACNCTCQNQSAVCTHPNCPSLEGCHAIVRSSKLSFNCCNFCKGCGERGSLQSGSYVLDSNDPCTIKQCEAGVLTINRLTCYTPCLNPMYVPGQCCLSCPGCYYEGTEYAAGQTFTPQHDSSISCTCGGDSLTCVGYNCPVLNCPKDKIIHKDGERCPSCRGSMLIANESHCVLANATYRHLEVHTPDRCTICVCKVGTMECQRLQCPKLNCPATHQVTLPDRCCPSCVSTFRSVGDNVKKLISQRKELSINQN